jgi:hypothetical protein
MQMLVQELVIVAKRGAKHPPNQLCPALVSLVFLHTFFGLAQFCKKLCNPVFNVLQFFTKNGKRMLFFIANLLSTFLALQAQVLNPLRSYACRIALTVGIP